MGWRLTEWPLFLRDQPEAARARVLDALHRSEGVVLRAAELLGLSVRNLYYAMERLGMLAEVERIRDEYRARRKKQPLRYSAEPVKPKPKPVITAVRKVSSRSPKGRS